MSPDPRIVVALDFTRPQDAEALVQRLDPALCRLKVGKELFTRAGPSLVRQLVDADFAVFLDLKFHDIPTTVARAVTAAADLGVWMVNVHASGGPRMLEEARKACGDDVLLIGVTVLTSMTEPELRSVGVVDSTDVQVGRLARLCADAGLDGVVCSAREAAALKRNHGREFVLVTPGIRPVTAAADDQSRVVTPRDAVMQGADYLVMGRPVTQADDPVQALLTIRSEIDGI